MREVAKVIFTFEQYIMSQIDVLNLEWTSSGRDIHIVEPVLCYLELKGCIVKRSSYLFGIAKIVAMNPKMLILSNNCGSIRNFIASKLAYKLGIKVVTLSSEGDYCVLSNADSIESFFWGWDLQREFPVDLHLEWSNKNIDLIRNYVKHSGIYLNKIKVSGGTGFDRYSLFTFKSKENLLEEHNKREYKKAIGYATWGFDSLYDKAFCESSTFGRSKDYIKFHKKNRDLLKNVLHKIVVNNPNVLFVIKRHPGELIFEETEVYGLEKFDNVLMIKNEENIEDLISACDFWMAYESTTCLEAWLLGKKTLLINPIPFFDERSDIANGSPVKCSYEEVCNDIASGNIVGFDELKSVRDSLLTKIIGYSDGKNYRRAGDYIIEEFKAQKKRDCNIDTWCIKVIAKELAKAIIYYSPLRYIGFFRKKIKDCIEFSKIYDDKEREGYIKIYSKAIVG